MAALVKLLPMLSHGATGYRVNKIRGQFLHWPQNEAVIKDIRTRQPYRWLVENKIAVEQQVDIQRARNKFCITPLAPRYVMNGLNLRMHVDRGIIGFEAHDEIQEI